MKQLTINSRGRETTQFEVMKYLKSKGLSLPESVIQFFVNQNPKDIEECYFETNDKEYTLDCFYPFDRSSELSFQSSYENLRDFLKDRYLSFACDPGGWQFVISVQGHDHGKVYFCRMDQELESAVILVADSFEDLINNLSKPPY